MMPAVAGKQLTPIKCSKCSFTSKRVTAVEAHMEAVHGLTAKHVWDSEHGGPVMCACGCGAETKWLNYKDGYSRMLKGHNASIDAVYDKETADKIRSTRGKNWKGVPHRSKGLTKETDEWVKKRGERTSIGRTKAFAENKIVIWSKGLTKDTDERLALQAKTQKQRFADGELTPWAKGLTKETDERVAKLAASVTLAHSAAPLREQLDSQKRFRKDQLLSMINEAGSKWTLLSDLSTYKSLNVKNVHVKCQAGHESITSINDIINDVYCKECAPEGLVGSFSHAFKPFNVFMSEFLEKRTVDEFSFDESTYMGISHPMSIRCNCCGHEFKKPPKQLVYEKFGCPKCALQARSDSQIRSWQQFLHQAKEAHGNAFTYHNEMNRDNYGNSHLVDRTCNKCNTREEQSIASHLGGNGCKTCSGKRKHTIESFIERSKKIWGADKFNYDDAVYVNNKVPIKLTCNKGHKFQTAASNHFNKKGCPHCAMKKFVSAGETEWLDSLGVPKENRNVWITINGQKFNVDGLMGMTAYEYYGDFWHGNPERFPSDSVNQYSGMTMAELFEHTMTREQLLREGGFVVIRMWEQQWMQLRKTRKPIA